jgi:hypothetical protein
MSVALTSGLIRRFPHGRCTLPGVTALRCIPDGLLRGTRWPAQPVAPRPLYGTRSYALPDCRRHSFSARLSRRSTCRARSLAACSRVGAKRVTLVGTFPSPPPRTVLAAFTAHGSPACRSKRLWSHPYELRCDIQSTRRESFYG